MRSIWPPSRALRGLNAFVDRDARARPRDGRCVRSHAVCPGQAPGRRCGPARRDPAGDQGPVLHRRRALSTASSSHILQDFRIRPMNRPSPANLWRRGCGDARQDQHGRVRHGLGQRYQLPTGRVDQPLEGFGRRRGGQPRPGARRIVGRFRRRRWPRGWRSRRRPAPTLVARSASPALALRHRRHEADLRTLLALGHRLRSLRRWTRRDR